MAYNSTEATAVQKTVIDDDILSKQQSTTDGDDAQLQHLGIGPSKLERNFNVWSLLFMSFCTSSTWEAVLSASAQSLTSGGSSSFVWGFAASAIGIIFAVLCISEYSSMIPSSGGQYHYVSKLSPPQYRRIFSWYAGWITILGWVLATTAGIFATAMQIQSWVILFNDNYVYQRWHTSLITIALATVFTLFGIYEIKRLHHLIFIGMLTHVTGYICTVAYLLANTHPKNSAQYVFTDFTNLSGWESPGIAWSIGLLTSAISFVGWDSSTHMAEEMTHASRDLPRTMIANVVVSGILTFPWVVGIAFCFTDISAVLSGPVGRMSPFVQLIYNVSGGNQAATIGCTAFLPIMSFCGSGTSVISATSRIIWSFARDGGLPSSFARVNDKTKVPVAAILLTWTLIAAVSLIYVGNSTAYYGISSACAILMILSYGFPILINVVWGFKFCDLPRGVFTLGRYHRPIAVIALCWGTYLSIFLCFPSLYPVTAATMNYAVVVLGGGGFVATVCWFVYGRRKYTGLQEVLESHYD